MKKSVGSGDGDVALDGDEILGHEEWTFSPAGWIASSRGHYDEAEYSRQVSGDRGDR